eukprot:COSAG02_NODE_4259_length_5577_cov_12.639102_1_plen_562_part_10
MNRTDGGSAPTDATSLASLSHVQFKTTAELRATYAMEDELVIVEAPMEENAEAGEVDAWELVEEEGDSEVSQDNSPTDHVDEAHVEIAEIAQDDNEQDGGSPNNDEGSEQPAADDLNDTPDPLEDDDEEDQGEDDTTDGSATAEIEMTPAEEYADDSDDQPSCAEELQSAYAALCARNVQRLQQAKELNADLNAKVHLALGDLKPKLVQAYAEAAEAAAECCGAVQEHAKQAADKVKEVITEIDTIPNQPGLTVLTPAMVIAALLVAILSWMASSAGVAEVAPHNQAHMETLTLLEKEMGRLPTITYQHVPIITTQPTASPGFTISKKNRTHTKKNRTRSHLDTKPHRGQVRNNNQRVARTISPMDTLINNTVIHPATRVAYDQTRRASNISEAPSSNTATALVQAEGWSSMDQRISEAIVQRSPRRIAGVYNSIGYWSSVDHHVAVRAGWVQRRDKTVEDILHAVDGRAMERPDTALSKRRARRGFKRSRATSSSTALAVPSQIDIGHYVYTSSETNLLMLRSDAMSHGNQQQVALAANLNLSVLALGDGTTWPTIPLPST